MKLAVIIGSTRQNRQTPRMARWIETAARQQLKDVEVELLDLKNYNLPLIDEPKPPQAGGRTLSNNVKKWNDDMASADGYIIVTPEYNHGMPAALKNALDLLDFQLVKKPVAIASHGVVGGARANEQVRLVVNSNLGAVPIPESVTVADWVEHEFSEDGQALGETAKRAEKPLENMLKSVRWYAETLKSAREK